MGFHNGPVAETLAALHLPNFVIVAGTSSLLLTSWRRRYWRQIVFGAAFALSVWTLGLCLLHGTPLPLLGTLVLMMLLPAGPLRHGAGISQGMSNHRLCGMSRLRCLCGWEVTPGSNIGTIIG